MGLKDRANRDIQRITGNAKEYNQIQFIAPTGETATVTGMDSKIHLAVDSDGNIINSKKATISFSEKFLTNQNYPVRNSHGYIDLEKHRVNVADSNGNIKHYIMLSFLPDETVGMITCILQDYAPN